MDLKVYYQKIREQESKISEAFPVVVSAATQDGGRAGVQTEVPKAVAARMIVDGVAKLASSEEAKSFRKTAAEAKAKAESDAEAAKMQFTVVQASPRKS